MEFSFYMDDFGCQSVTKDAILWQDVSFARIQLTDKLYQECEGAILFAQNVRFNKKDDGIKSKG